MTGSQIFFIYSYLQGEDQNTLRFLPFIWFLSDPADQIPLHFADIDQIRFHTLITSGLTKVTEKKFWLVLVFCNWWCWKTWSKQETTLQVTISYYNIECWNRAEHAVKESKEAQTWAECCKGGHLYLSWEALTVRNKERHFCFLLC